MDTRRKKSWTGFFHSFPTEKSFHFGFVINEIPRWWDFWIHFLTFIWKMSLWAKTIYPVRSTTCEHKNGRNRKANCKRGKHIKSDRDSRWTIGEADPVGIATRARIRSGCLNCGHATELTRMLTCKITEKFRSQSQSQRKRMGKPNEWMNRENTI